MRAEVADMEGPKVETIFFCQCSVPLSQQRFATSNHNHRLAKRDEGRRTTHQPSSQFKFPTPGTVPFGWQNKKRRRRNGQHQPLQKENTPQQTKLWIFLPSQKVVAAHEQ